MFRKVNPVIVRGSECKIQTHKPVAGATCLLCRVLWPMVVQHRHLVFADSSEAKTLIGPASTHITVRFHASPA